MRQLSEINKDIDEIDGKIKALKVQRGILSDEERRLVKAGRAPP